MKGTMINGRCTVCHAPAEAAANRPFHALPCSYMLHGQYLIGRVIGNGGFGITYLAWDTKWNRRVAVKELYPGNDVTRIAGSTLVKVKRGQESFYAHVGRRFQEEARLMMSFQNDPNILQVYHLFPDNNTAYYAMEYLEGMDLKHFLEQKGKVAWKQIAPYIQSVLAALIILHKKDLIHRDISPDNIFLVGPEKAKLIDFGSVRCYTGENGLTTFVKHHFSPIEQYRENGNQGPWTDIYSLSVVIYYALSGKLPPKAADRALRGTPVEDLSLVCPDLPPYVAAAVMRGMAVMPEQRYQTVKEFNEALFRGQEWNRPAPENPAARKIFCTKGYLKGQSWAVSQGSMVRIGRSNCEVLYPADRKGVSRHHFSLICDYNGKMQIRDEQSSFGTFVNGKRLQSKVWYVISPGAVIDFGQEQFLVK